jgi:hypothetical protein
LFQQFDEHIQLVPVPHLPLMTPTMTPALMLTVMMLTLMMLMLMMLTMMTMMMIDVVVVVVDWCCSVELLIELLRFEHRFLPMEIIVLISKTFSMLLHDRLLALPPRLRRALFPRCHDSSLSRQKKNKTTKKIKIQFVNKISHRQI